MAKTYKDFTFDDNDDPGMKNLTVRLSVDVIARIDRVLASTPYLNRNEFAASAVRYALDSLDEERDGTWLD